MGNGGGTLELGKGGGAEPLGTKAGGIGFSLVAFVCVKLLEGSGGPAGGTKGGGALFGLCAGWVAMEGEAPGEERGAGGTTRGVRDTSIDWGSLEEADSRLVKKEKIPDRRRGRTGSYG